MITAGLLLTAVAHPGMLFPNEILDSPVPADILNVSWNNVGQTSSGGRSCNRLRRNEDLRTRTKKHEQLRMDRG